MENESERIGEYMRQLLARYNSIRGKNPRDEGVDFWDLVVISAADPEQESWYSAQLDSKREHADLPTGIDFLCVSDPPGPRIGSGGSTLHILQLLYDQLGDSLHTRRILIIHAGGYSKRLPSHSCSGKIFSPLPILPTSGGPFQMLDLKLALFLPFLEVMESGVFITASDDIEVFNIDQIPTPGSGEGVTALAHPSSLGIGSTHGVYVMEQAEADSQNLVELRSCLEVLQKPSIDLMRSRGAVFTREGQEKVFSDSAFWINSTTTKKLISFYQEVVPLKEELCIYGDLLTLMGTSTDKDYLHRLDNMDQSCGKVQLSQKLRACVGSTQLNILKMNMSKFYHLGTVQEYLEELTGNDNLRRELNLANVICSTIVQSNPDIKVKRADGIQGVMLNSRVTESLTLPGDSILEYSIIDTKMTVNPRTIISNVMVEQVEGQDPDLVVPGGYLYHTVPIRTGDLRHLCMFVTVAFHINDDLKSSVDTLQAGELQYGGQRLSAVSSILSGSSLEQICPPSSDASTSLWSAKLFPAAASMSASFRLTVSRLSALLENKVMSCEDENLNASVSSDALFSMDDLVRLKDGEAILQFRRLLSRIS